MWTRLFNHHHFPNTQLAWYIMVYLPTNLPPKLTKCAMVKSRYIGDGRPPTFNRNPHNGYINPYYWVDDHPLLYGNHGSLDLGTNVEKNRKNIPYIKCLGLEIMKRFHRSAGRSINCSNSGGDVMRIVRIVN